jgi:dTDP-4-dehydrorhamnose 3,5-epimerase
VRLEPLAVGGAFVVAGEPVADERGSFARLYDAELFAAAGLCTTWVQTSTSLSHAAGTLRGLHFQRPPHAEIKLVRCTRGALLDVVVDTRDGSNVAVELRAGDARSIYVPEHCAHGFQTLADNTEVHYTISVAYVAAAATGIAWDDPALAIGWPSPPPGGRTISERDRAWPSLAEPH